MRVLRVCICLFALVNSQASTSFGSTWPPEPSQGSDPAQDQSKKPKTQKPTTKGASAGSNAAPASGQSATDKKTQDQKTAAFQSRLAKIFDPSRVDLSDYVPCHFTVSELLQLRPAPPTPRLTGQEAEALKEQVEADALAQEEAGFLDPDSKRDFVTSVARADLEGLTPSAALATIVALFRAADKAGAVRRNPGAALSLYQNNPLQGLAVLAGVAPSDPIGNAWANSVSQQVYERGVSFGVGRGLMIDQAGEVFQVFASPDFREKLAGLAPKEALKEINDESKRILDDENAELADLQARATKMQSLGFDGGTTAAAVDRAAKASDEANKAAEAAKELLKLVERDESDAHTNLNVAQNRVQSANEAMRAVSAPGLVPNQALLADLQQKAQAAQAAVAGAQRSFDVAHQKLLAAQQDADQKSKAQDAAAKTLREAQQQAIETTKIPQDLKDAKKGVAAASAASKDVAGASQPTPSGAAPQAIINGARSTIEAFKRPPDIGCAMSILSWNETRYEYGRLLANEYIGVQVVVRNLSETQEFVMHDGAFAVDTDLTGRKGRFFSGRDKLIVRGMSAADADFSPRNMLVHMMESVGTIMSAVIPIAGTTFSNASSVYNSGFLQGLHKTWADHNTDHLNLLNDTAFSSATAYKTVVPKSGSVMFVMFIPAKQFEQGWWAQPCAQAISNGILLDSADPDGSNAEAQRQAGATSSAEAKSGSNPMKTEDQIGIDLQRARDACKRGGGAPNDNVNSDSDLISPSLPSNVTPFKTIHYKNWPGNALAVFRELAFTIVSGVHVNEASQNKPGISDINCGKEDNLGNIDFNLQSGGNLTCDVKGQNLDKVQKLRLRNSTDDTDLKVAEGAVTVSGDATAAKVAFPLSQIGPLDGASYKVFPVNKDGVEGAGSQTLHFSRTPFVAPPTPNPITIDLDKDLDKDFKKKIDLQGYHLDKVTKVQLQNDSMKDPLEFNVEKPSAAQASFVFDPSKLDKTSDFSKNPYELKMTFTTSDKANPSVPSLTRVTLSGKVPATTPATPAAGENPGAGGANGGTPPTAPVKKPQSKPPKPPPTQ